MTHDGFAARLPLQQVLRALSWSTVSFGVRTVAALLTFTLIARHFGATAFGSYAGTMGFVALVTGFATLGSAELAARAIERRGEAGQTINDLASRVVVALPIVLILTVLIGTLVLNTGSSLGERALIIGLLALGEFAISGVLESANSLLVALDRHARAALISAGGSILRLGAVLVVIAMDSDEVLSLAVGLGVSGSVAALAGVAVLRSAGISPGWSPNWRAGVREGLDLALGSTARKTVQDVDQAMLLRAGFTVDTGLYGIGARLAHYAFLPAMIVLQVTYPRYFEHGRLGIGASMAYAKRVGTPLLVYGVLVGSAIVAGRDLVPWILGSEFDGSATIVAALCAVPFLRIAHSVLGDILISSGHVAARTRPVVAGAAINVAANVVLIPLYSWKGALAATYLTEIFITVVYLAIIRQQLACERLSVSQSGTTAPSPVFEEAPHA